MLENIPDIINLALEEKQTNQQTKIIALELIFYLGFRGDSLKKKHLKTNNYSR